VLIVLALSFVLGSVSSLSGMVGAPAVGWLCDTRGPRDAPPRTANRLTGAGRRRLAVASAGMPG
jgi:hypothetical protein